MAKNPFSPALLLLLAFGAVACGGDGSGAEPQPPVATTLQSAAPSQHEGVVGTTVADSIGVRVLDQRGAGMAGVPVQFAVAAGAGSVSPAAVSTGADGYARAAWTLGTAAGEQRVEASTTSLSAAPVVFTAVSRPGPPATASVTGSEQTGPVASALPQPAAVRIVDAFGNPVAGVQLAWSLPAGQGGTVTPAAAATDAAGAASAGWTLGTRSGVQTLAVRAAGGPAAVFSANAAPLAPTKFEKVAGDSAKATVGTALATPLSVRVADLYDNPVPGVPVTWGDIFGAGTLAPAGATTGADGIVRATWTLGTGAHMHRASAFVLGRRLEFSATGIPGPVAFMMALGGVGQTARIRPPSPGGLSFCSGGVLPFPLGVGVMDRYNNPVEGATIRWEGSDGSAPPSTTNAEGFARGTWTLGGRVGTQKIEAVSATGVRVEFDALVSAGPPIALEKVEGDNQSGRLNARLRDYLMVRVTDGCANPIGGVAVYWSSPTGTLDPPVTGTTPLGLTGTSWTLQGTLSSFKSASAFLPVPGGAGATVHFTATALP